ncbi:hypothetical protein F2P81_002368 [Scophthalmus maximus]|uniref:Uncharacterized protein n=1 Tax=Scophthalmus maximus TaxID=52904 RepID=A0A6A4TLX0_SCOMX|nr:hypothetical protein F2P81_002368 [Scophthalmus maximus]
MGEPNEQGAVRLKTQVKRISDHSPLTFNSLMENSLTPFAKRFCDAVAADVVKGLQASDGSLGVRLARRVRQAKSLQELKAP